MLAAILFVGCSAVDPTVRTAAGTSLGGYDVVYFTFQDDWSTQHSITELLQQEFARRRFAVLREEPAPHLWERTLRLRLEVVEDGKLSLKRRQDRLGRLIFRLERMSDGVEVGKASYEGSALDRIEQRDLAEEIVAKLLQGA